ncbi:MAG TPA: PIG-L family deacetylase [Thermoanaerobaculia bacterium]|nr:PIG-L family deacetylase [Thermoanaerobaculia bacterium]
MRKLYFVLIALLLLPVGAFARTASELQLALKKLTVVGSALYVAAHPDDENTAMLAWLSNDRLVRTSYMSLTRGDGGQNLIGDEKGELLGVIRTQELLAARRIDGAEQYFSRAIDFGFTKSPQETLSIWDRDKVLADVVWVIRKVQPDVIITRFPTTGEGGHGQHTASAIMAEEAFRLAGDPTKFPEQLKYVGVWQPKRIFWNRFGWQRLDPNSPELANDIRIDLGGYSPLLGRSYTEIAGESRSQHKSQGFGARESRGTQMNYFKLTGGDPAHDDLFEGVNLTWSRYAGGEKVGTLLQQAYDTFDAHNPAKSIPTLLQALQELDRLGATEAWSSRANPWIDVKRRELLEAIRGCAGLSIDVSAGDSAVTPGGEIPVSVTVVNRSDVPLTLSTVASPYASPGKAPNVALKYNEPVKTDIVIRVPADMPYSQPYWLRKAPSKGMFNVDDQTLIGRAENPPAIPITVSFNAGFMQTLIFTVPAVYRWVDAVRGEQVRNVDIVPAVTANLDEHVYLFPDAKPKNVAIKLRDFAGATDGTVSLEVPKGWQVSPASVPLSMKKKSDEADVKFVVTPGAAAGQETGLRTVVDLGSRKLSYQLTTIDYPHIPAQRVFSDADSRLVRIDLKRRGQRVGYIMGSGDEIPDFLRQSGYDVTMLTDADLDAANFSRFDAIVAGVRAYNTRPAMRTAHGKLLAWVEKGGTYVVQYSSLNPQPLLVDPPGPYPFKVTSERVTVEEAPVRILDPSHPLLTTPNKITAEDFNGWVQERGVYFTKDWDTKYQTVLESHDPGEPDHPGGELYTHYGKGVFIYTGYAWFRQLPAGVPGAFRLFVNLVSAR